MDLVHAWIIGSTHDSQENSDELPLHYLKPRVMKSVMELAAMMEGLKRGVGACKSCCHLVQSLYFILGVCLGRDKTLTCFVGGWILMSFLVGVGNLFQQNLYGAIFMQKYRTVEDQAAFTVSNISFVFFHGELVLWN